MNSVEAYKTHCRDAINVSLEAIDRAGPKQALLKIRQFKIGDRVEVIGPQTTFNGKVTSVGESWISVHDGDQTRFVDPLFASKLAKLSLVPTP